MSPEEIIAAARSMLKTPFKHQARVPGRGLDCAGLLVCTCWAVGLPVEDVQGYGRNPWSGQLEQAIRRQPFLREVPKTDLRPSDVLLMRFSKAPQHVAIVTDLGIIHAYEHSGAVVEHRLADVWRARITHAFRFEGIQ